jgi:DNA-binding LacI/PurR family transcriptional regulator
MARKYTLQQIAQRAGVSVATVSRIVNGTARVSRDIQGRVRRAAQELGIDLSETNKSKTIAFVLGNREMLHPFHSHILLGAEDCCRARGWDLLFLSFQYAPHVPPRELHLPQVMMRRDVARAVILAGTNYDNLLAALAHRDAVFAALGNNIVGEYRPEGYDVIYSDDVLGGHEMTRYLQSLGHTYIWFVGNTRLPWYARCYQGYCEAMKEAGLTPRLAGLDSGDEQEIGYLCTKSILARREKVTAIFAGTDPTAQGVYRAAAERGLRIPQDLSVTGCNDTYGGVLHPPLTTIHEYPEQLGKQLVEMVLRRIADPDLAPQQVTLPTSLVKRESCLPAVATGHRSLRSHERAAARP